MFVMIDITKRSNWVSDGNRCPAKVHYAVSEMDEKTVRMEISTGHS
jgi:hypothetical protein